MAKLGSFFRRLFTSNSSDDRCSSSSSLAEETDKTVRVVTPVPYFKSNVSEPATMTSQSCNTSPRPLSRLTIKQQAMNSDTRAHTFDSNFLSSPLCNVNTRRLSAPPIAHIMPYDGLQYAQKKVNDCTEKILLSSSPSSSPQYSYSPISTTTTKTYSANNAQSLTVHGSRAHSPVAYADSLALPINLSLSPRSLNNTLVNNVLPSSDTPPSQSAVGTQSSPRVSIPSNNSPSHNNAMKDVSPSVETTANVNSDRKMSLQPRGRRPSMFDPIDPKELQQALYASAAAKASLPMNATNDDDSNRTLSSIKISYDRDCEHVFIDNVSFENMHMLDAFANNYSNNTSNSMMTASSSMTTASVSPSLNDFIPIYCRFRLWPEKRCLFQTRIVRYPRSQTSYLFDGKQLNDFELSFDQLNNHSIELILYKVGTTKPSYKDIRVATAKYELSGLLEIDRVSLRKPLDESDPSYVIQDPDLGDLLVSLSYLQSAAKLAVVVLEARCLRPLSIESKPFPEACVKVTLFDRNGKRIKRKKTSVQRASDCPTFNEELVFELRRDLAQEVMIELRIVHESLSYKEQLGSVVFGPTINNMMKGSISPENVYWSTILAGESLNAQWQMLKTPTRIDESK